MEAEEEEEVEEEKEKEGVQAAAKRKLLARDEKSRLSSAQKSRSSAEGQISGKDSRAGAQKNRSWDKKDSV